MIASIHQFRPAAKAAGFSPASNLSLLAAHFPPAYGLRGACTTLLDLARYYADGHVSPPKSYAFHLVIDAAMERTLSGFQGGKGNEAARRILWIEAGHIAEQDELADRMAEEDEQEAAQAETAAWFDCLRPVTAAELEEQARLDAARRPSRGIPHEL